MAENYFLVVSGEKMRIRTPDYFELPPDYPLTTLDYLRLPSNYLVYLCPQSNIKHSK